MKLQFNHNCASLILIVVIIDFQFSFFYSAIDRLNQLKPKCELFMIQTKTLGDIWLPYFFSCFPSWSSKKLFLMRNALTTEDAKKCEIHSRSMKSWPSMGNCAISIWIINHALSVTYFCFMHHSAFWGERKIDAIYQFITPLSYRLGSLSSLEMDFYTITHLGVALCGL